MKIISELRGLIRALDASDLPYALCGGMAVAVYGFPRATADIDMLIEEASLEKALALARRRGFSHRPGDMVFRNGAIRIVRLVKIDPKGGEVLPLDLLVVTSAIRKVWEGRELLTTDLGPLWVVSRDGLAALKSLRDSGTDRDDIARLREKHED